MGTQPSLLEASLLQASQLLSVEVASLKQFKNQQLIMTDFAKASIVCGARPKTLATSLTALR